MQKAKSKVLEESRVAAVNEALAVAFLEKQRWDGAPRCPLCESEDVYQMKARNGERNKDYRWRCRGCGQMYSIRTKSVLEETRLPLRVWVYAIWKAASSKKGYSALQLSREMEITHKSALFVLRRLRHGMNEDQFRWNTRKLDDGERVSRVIKQIVGKRLEYRESVENPPYQA